jgi:hypothetical protein
MKWRLSRGHKHPVFALQVSRHPGANQYGRSYVDDSNDTDPRNSISGLTLPLKGCATASDRFTFAIIAAGGARMPSGTVTDKVTFDIVDNRGKPVAYNLSGEIREYEWQR